MAGWVPLDADSWPIIAEMLPHPWPIEAVHFDLRWWKDRAKFGVKRPGRPALADRWGWRNGHRVREVMKDEATWGDPSLNGQECPAASARTADGQPADSARTGCERVNANNTGTVDRSRTARGQPADSARTRGEKILTHPTPSPYTHTFALVSRLLDEVVAPRLNRAPFRLTKDKGIGKTLNVRLNENGAPLVWRVIEWWLLGEDKRARYLREEGYGLDTILRPTKFHTYLDFANNAYRGEDPAVAWEEACRHLATLSSSNSNEPTLPLTPNAPT